MLGCLPNASSPACSCAVCSSALLALLHPSSCCAQTQVAQAQPLPIRMPVVKGTASCPAASSVVSRTAGSCGDAGQQNVVALTHVKVQRHEEVCGHASAAEARFQAFASCCPLSRMLLSPHLVRAGVVCAPRLQQRGGGGLQHEPLAGADRLERTQLLPTHHACAREARVQLKIHGRQARPWLSFFAATVPPQQRGTGCKANTIHLQR